MNSLILQLINSIKSSVHENEKEKKLLQLGLLIEKNSINYNNDDIELLIEPEYLKIKLNENDIKEILDFLLYGQEFHFQNKKSFAWNKNSSELIYLNFNGSVTINIELSPIKREELTIKENTFIFTDPDGEDLQGVLKKITFGTRSAN